MNPQRLLVSRELPPSRREVDGLAAHFFDDLQTLERLTERSVLRSSLLAYAQINLFTARFDLNWLVVADM
jgi:hypothetical protein